MTATVLATRISDTKRLSQIKFSSVSSSTWAWPWCTHGRSITSSIASVSFTHLSITNFMAWTLSASNGHHFLKAYHLLARQEYFPSIRLFCHMSLSNSRDQYHRSVIGIETIRLKLPTSGLRHFNSESKEAININNLIQAVPKNPPSRSHLTALRR